MAYIPLIEAIGIQSMDIPAEVSIGYLSCARKNPHAGRIVRLSNEKYAAVFPLTVLHLGADIIPCPCCGKPMVTLNEMPGFWPAEALEELNNG